ncbi:MAG: dihydroorotase family protein [Candidatus Pacearchaeota archaeon]|nr:dihydroorotase family protein [Candidatus Pacearchaeota archaeon]
MIDPHVHDRDWEQRYKETTKHAMWIAFLAGDDGIIIKPNTAPGITERKHVVRKLKDSRDARRDLGIQIFYGIEMGLTSDIEQVKRAVNTYREFFPSFGDCDGVVGFKSYTINSGGGVYAETREHRRAMLATLVSESYDGVVSWHCEDKLLFKPELWDPKNPITHSYSRPSISESSVAAELIADAEELRFKGTMVVSHVSTPKTLDVIDKARKNRIIKVAAEVTPHHCLMYDEMMSWEDGILKKVNPPLRSEQEAKEMFLALKEERIDFSGSDHASHDIDEKTGKALDAKGNPMFMSGFPGSPFYPHWVNYLRGEGFSEEQIRNLTHANIERVYGIKVPESGREPRLDLHNEYEVDVYRGIRK